MKNYQSVKYKFLAAEIFCLCFLLFGAAFSVSAQSIDQNFPTPIVSNEISGKILARDIGDARLTSYFYAFDGTQGDVFINVVTNNFNGDIDVFTADNLRPLTKITIYANDTDSETGRVVYLRQPLKLILRIQGRSPNDDAATFRLKFAGSFVASKADDKSEPKTPEVKSSEETGIRVNSVGTIIEVKPKPTPTPKATALEKNADKPPTIARVEKPTKVRNINKKRVETPETNDSTNAEKSAVKTEEKKSENPTIITIDKNPSPIEEKTSSEAETKTSENKPTESSPKIVINGDVAEKKTETTTIEIKKDSSESSETVVEKKPEKTISEKKQPVKTKKKNNPEPVPTAALENIHLVILFKDGTKIERPMSEILKFGVDRGILTVISKDGAIGRYSILDIEKTTIQ